MTFDFISAALSRVDRPSALRRLAALLPVVLLGVGCQSLPPGRLDAVNATSNHARKGNVYLFRGWQDLYSEGIDRLAAELCAAGVRAQVYQAAQWPQLATALSRAYRHPLYREPLVLIGFSYGADDALLVSRQLDADRIKVDLVVTIDPVTPVAVPGNVRACYDFYQSNGALDLLPWMRGIPVQPDGAAQVVNIDLRRERPDLLEPDTSHGTIARGPKLHRAIIERVLGVCPPRRK